MAEFCDATPPESWAAEAERSRTWHFSLHHRKAALDEAIGLHFAMPRPHLCRGRTASPWGIVSHASPAAMALRDSSERSKSLGYARRPSPRGTKRQHARPGRMDSGDEEARVVTDSYGKWEQQPGHQQPTANSKTPAHRLSRTASPLSTSSVREAMWRRKCNPLPRFGVVASPPDARGRVRISCPMWLSRRDKDGE